MRVVVTGVGVRVDAEGEEFVRTTLDFATWYRQEARGVALVRLERTFARTGPGVRCLVRAEIEGAGAIQIDSRGEDVWQAVSAAGLQLEDAFLARINRVAATMPESLPSGLWRVLDAEAVRSKSMVSRPLSHRMH